MTNEELNRVRFCGGSGAKESVIKGGISLRFFIKCPHCAVSCGHKVRLFQQKSKTYTEFVNDELQKVIQMEQKLIANEVSNSLNP